MQKNKLNINTAPRDNQEIYDKYVHDKTIKEHTITKFLNWLEAEKIHLTKTQNQNLIKILDSYIDDKNLRPKFDFLKGRVGKRAKRKLKKKPDQTFLIRMKYNNNTSKNFILSTTDMMFRHGKTWYFLYYEESYFNINCNIYELEYHEDHCLPINREIQIEKTDDKEKNKENEIFNCVTPRNLKATIDMEYVKALVSGEELSKFIKIILVLSAFTVIGTLLIAIQLYQMMRGGG